ncbi:MAG: hypothetical protein JWL77_2299 [Chthonomonadaceae bacterium]|nr:hypothetical protein [Chthonomonadaceae bacterium]
MPPKYNMTISRLTIDKLGVKLYDKVSAVLAELVANSYDADATEVTIKAPMNNFLATKQGPDLIDKGYTVEIADNGIGMTPEEINEFYLKVGAERRSDPKRGAKSRTLKRAVMGRKGVGKLAPFGICRHIEIISSGGEPVDGIDEEGNPSHGYLTAHLMLDRSNIIADTDTSYTPEVGGLDERVRQIHGTVLRLSGFAHRRVPTIEDLARQMAQRFGIQSDNWKIVLVDGTAEIQDDSSKHTVGQFDVKRMVASDGTENTTITFAAKTTDGSEEYVATNSDNNILSDLTAGFTMDGKFYPITGWVAYASEPYKDDLMAGIRIYCHKKIAAQTAVFNRGAGFTGEYDVRSYLIGELHADWLDEEEDLIQTDRRDILWSHELGKAFEEWGQAVVLKMGKITRDPLRQKTWNKFREVSDIRNKVNQAFPLPGQENIRDKAIELAKLLGKSMRSGEMEDTGVVDSIVTLSVNLAPHVTLNEKLREAADSHDSPLAVMTSILKTARIAELSSFGNIAADRVKVIATVEELKDNPATLEDAFQDLIEQAPWLIDPQWSPITSNQSFSTLRTEFAKYCHQRTGESFTLGSFTDPAKRADFVLSNQDNRIEIIEIKRPHHRFDNTEMERLVKYHDLMDEFLKANAEFAKLFPSFHLTLVCDEANLTGAYNAAFEGYISKGVLTWINWKVFLLRTKRVHQSFLDETERQKMENAALSDIT